jgi:hypothetical protein
MVKVPSAVAPPVRCGLRQLSDVADRQTGVVTRAQVLALGFSDDWLEHRVHSGRWQRVYPGVYAAYTGQVRLEARHWAAVLACGPGAALAGRTAIGRWLGEDIEGDDQPIQVAIDHRRRIAERDGIDLWRVGRLDQHTHPVRCPPRMRLEPAVLLLASRSRHLDDAIGVVADACQSRRTSPSRLLETLRRLPATMRHRRVLRELLDDIATGAYSYLEVHYLRDVERPHGLPTGHRQRRVTRGGCLWFRDVDYLRYDLVAELDGRLGHERYADRAGDMERDAIGATDGKTTIRLGYQQVIVTPCRTAQHVVDLLRVHGWPGQARQCGPTCPVR